jgi:hypothetical protein
MRPAATVPVTDLKEFIMLKRILLALVPVIVSRVMSKRGAAQAPRANKMRYNGK